MKTLTTILLTLALCGCASSEPVPPVTPQTNGVGYKVAATDTDTTLASVNFDWLSLSDPNGVASTNWTLIATVPYVVGQTNYIAPLDAVPVNTLLTCYAVGTNGMKSLSAAPITFTTATNAPSALTVSSK
jgi:hypothetical protein